MDKITKIWVFKYKLKHPEYIGYHQGDVTVTTHKEDTVERALVRARTQAHSTLTGRNVEFEDGHTLELTLDICYTI